MEAYANALLVAIPLFMVLMGIEMLYGHLKGKQTYTLMDTLSSLSSGMTNVLKDSLGLVVILVSYPYLKDHLAVQELSSTIWTYIIAFICIDFASYWAHRLNHKVNIFWNQHIIHHSSEEFNLACALRQSISNVLGFGALFLLPAAVLGVPEKVIQILAPLHLFAQFWYHTQHIGKLGILEYLIVTPSQHRVHHAINPIYIDKNLAAIFCVWDRLFGTFQEELEDEPPVYGTLKPVNSWNPLWINFQHLWGLIQDAWRTKSWKAKLLIWFKPTGWRPQDVAKKWPCKSIESVNHQEKYQTNLSKNERRWAIFHWLGTTLLLMVFLAVFADLTPLYRLAYGALIFISIFGYTAVMDRNSWGISFEWGRTLLGISTLLLLEYFSVFSNQNSGVLRYYSTVYFALSLLLLFGFINQPKADEQPA
ncbi:MAG: fatty acid hydroxylase family protein [Flavobacteriia bacterium]|nr:fatty acid hydroxylase family protein [Flavobacteriia bacterium]